MSWSVPRLDSNSLQIATVAVNEDPRTLYSWEEHKHEHKHKHKPLRPRCDRLVGFGNIDIEKKRS